MKNYEDLVISIKNWLNTMLEDKELPMDRKLEAALIRECKSIEREIVQIENQRAETDKS